MRFYKLTNDEDSGFKPHYLCTVADVKAAIADVPKTMWQYLYVDLVEITTDQKTIASILSGWGCEEKTSRSWTVTPRGGLKETEVES